MIEKVVRNNERPVRFAAESSHNEIKKSKNNGFGRQVFTYATRPEGPANFFGLWQPPRLAIFEFLELLDFFEKVF